jgi:predicted CopG family antitoxin
LVLKKKKKMSRVLARRAGKNSGNDADDFEDFFN